MSRRAAVFLVTVLLVAAAAGTARSTSHVCAAPEVRTHDEAVFGHFSTRAAATALARRAARVGFHGVKIEDDGCGDYETEIDGADREVDRVSFAKEAAGAGFQVTFEQTADPLTFQPGHVVGVFGRLKTVAAANTLSERLAAVNLRYVDIVAVGTRWWVVIPQVPIRSALSIAREAAADGFHVAFQPGRQT